MITLGWERRASGNEVRASSPPGERKCRPKVGEVRGVVLACATDKERGPSPQPSPRGEREPEAAFREGIAFDLSTGRLGDPTYHSVASSLRHFVTSSLPTAFFQIGTSCFMRSMKSAIAARLSLR